MDVGFVEVDEGRGRWALGCREDRVPILGGDDGQEWRQYGSEIGR